MEVSKYELAKYPFLSAVKEFLSKRGYELYEFDESMSNILDKSVKRIKNALNGELSLTLEDEEEEIISFMLALIMLRAINIKKVINKFAINEAKRVEYFLKNDLTKLEENIKDSFIYYIYKDIFKTDLNKEDGFYKIKVVDYIKIASHFHDSYWKLVNRDLDKGYVYLPLNDLIRLIREEISRLIVEKVNSISIKELPDSIKKRVNALKSEIESDYRFKPLVYTHNIYPPCITNVLKMLEEGENPPHMARFLLASYMLAIGKSIDEVCSLFVHAPDYNESKTRYQVEFIAGKRGSKKSYNCPSCEKIRSLNLCYRSEECGDIKSPLQFGKVKWIKRV